MRQVGPADLHGGKIPLCGAPRGPLTSGVRRVRRCGQEVAHRSSTYEAFPPCGRPHTPKLPSSAFVKAPCFTHFAIPVVLPLPDSDNFGIPRTLKRHYIRRPLRPQRQHAEARRKLRFSSCSPVLNLLSSLDDYAWQSFSQRPMVIVLDKEELWERILGERIGGSNHARRWRHDYGK